MTKIVNRAMQTVTSTGTGTLTLGPAVEGFQTFADAGVLTGDTINYVIEDGTAWEYGTGVFNGTTLARTVIQSSDSGSAPISVTTSATVYVTLFAQDLGVTRITGADGQKADVIESAGLQALAVAITEGTVTLADNTNRELGKVGINGIVSVTVTNTGPVPIQLLNDANDAALGDSIPLNVAVQNETPIRVELASEVGPHTHWRFRFSILSNFASGFTNFSRIELHSTVSGAAVMPDAVNGFDHEFSILNGYQNTPSDANWAFSTDPSEYWSVNTQQAGGPPWLEAIYNEPLSVAEIVVVSEPSMAGTIIPDAIPRMVDVFAGDGETYRYVTTVVFESWYDGSSQTYTAQARAIPTVLNGFPTVPVTAIGGTSEVSVTNVVKIAGEDGSAVASETNPMPVTGAVEVIGLNGYKLSEGGGAINVAGVDNQSPATPSNALPVSIYDLSGNMLGAPGTAPLAISLWSNDGGTILGQPGATPLEVNVMNSSPIEVTISAMPTVEVQPQFSSVSIESVTVNGGATPITLASAACKKVDVVNSTGVDLEYRRGGTGSYMPLPRDSARLIEGITNANAISIRRVDQAATAVTVGYEVFS